MEKKDFMERIALLSRRFRKKRPALGGTGGRIRLEHWVILKTLWNSRTPLSPDEISQQVCVRRRLMKVGQVYISLAKLETMGLAVRLEAQAEDCKIIFYKPLVTENEALLRDGDFIGSTLSKLEYILDAEHEDK